MAAHSTNSFYPDVQQQVILYCAMSNPFCKANMEIVWTDPLPQVKMLMETEERRHVWEQVMSVGKSWNGRCRAIFA